MIAISANQLSGRAALDVARAGCYWLLRITGWAAVCAACVVALNVLFFVMLGNFTVEGFLYHLDNFGSRYLAADMQRRAEFAATWLFANGLLFLLVCFFRRHSLALNSINKKEA